MASRKRTEAYESLLGRRPQKRPEIHHDQTGGWSVPCRRFDLIRDALQEQQASAAPTQSQFAAKCPSPSSGVGVLQRGKLNKQLRSTGGPESV